MQKTSICCLSHLLWERKLFQRPQQLMTQFESLGQRVQYSSLIGFKRWIKSTSEECRVQIGKHGKAENIPFIPLQKHFPFLCRINDYKIARNSKAFFNGTNAKRVLWMQHPAFVGAADRIEHDVLVYDCMDPFRAFNTFQEKLLESEAELLSRAHLVFTGGKSLHSLIEGQNPNMHCFPSGIDFPHFAKGAEPGSIPADLEAIKQPVLGYFGAVDERIDWSLMSKLCQAHPEWSIVFLGPLIKMSACPIQEPNFHYLGAKPYDVLPDYLRGFKVALIPWLVNHLTRYMSPTKTPEYLAAGRPVVSVAIPDVVADYHEDVFIANSAEEFILHCEKALEQGVGPAQKPLQSRTWTEIAQEMLNLIDKV